MSRRHKDLFGHVGRAIADYKMIESNDHIVVGVSGGKDSLLLCYLLSEMCKRSPVKFDLTAITINPGGDSGFSVQDLERIEEFLSGLDIPYHVKETSISKILENYQTKKTLCSLCANLRRGALHKTVRELGFSKVALAHHLDDAIETLFLNMFYQGSFRCFQPKTYLSRREVTVIRPLVYVTEEAIIAECERLGLPVVPAKCLVSGTTLRQTMKDLVNNLAQSIPGFRNQLRGVLRKTVWKSSDKDY